jgi:xanthosine utilization system XapX-like protein
MAYPIIPAPYGFKAVSEFGGLPYSGSTRMYPIATAYGTSLFNGDIVQLSGGTIVTTTMSAASSPATAVAGTLGIFVGAEYTNSSSQIVRGQYWPASTSSNYAVGYVIDDPRTVFKAVMVAQGTSLSNTAATVGYANATFIGTNLYAVTGTAGNTTTGDSAMAVSGAVITSGTSGNTRIATLLPFRCVGMVQDTAVTVTAVGGNANSSGTTITLTAANTAIQPGMQLVAQGVSGVAQGNYISVTNVNGTTVTLGSSIAVPTGTNLSFVGFPEVLVVWNQTFQGMTNTAGV